MPGLPGPEVLKRIVKEHPATAVLMLTGYGTIESAVEAVRAGAVDYLTKPVVDSELRIALQRALRQQALLAENRVLKARLDDRYGLDKIVGADHRMLKIYDLIEAVAPSKHHGAHDRRERRRARASSRTPSTTTRPAQGQAVRRDLVRLDPRDPAGERALRPRQGRVHRCTTWTRSAASSRPTAGTIFLDEINSASPAHAAQAAARAAGTQVSSLSAARRRRWKWTPASSSRAISPLEQLGRAAVDFRQDLYYRINVVTIDLPALRERVADIPLLAEHFLKKHGAALSRQFVGFTPEALDVLRRYAYPGNVRELENVIERAAVLSRSPTIGVEALPAHVLENSTAAMLPEHVRAKMGLSLKPQDPADAPLADEAWKPTPLEDALRDPERRIILKALKANAWNRQKTAEDLQINRTTLYKKMKALGIDGGEERIAG